MFLLKKLTENILDSNDDTLQLIDSIKTYAYKMSKCLVSKKRIYYMIGFDAVKKENIREHNPNWSQIPDHIYRVLIIGRR